MKFRTIFTHVIGSIHIAPCPTDLQTPHRGPTQLANDHRPPATSSLAHWLTAHRLTDLYCPTGSPTHWLTGSLATGHQPPTTHHRPPAHRLTGHRPPAHRLTGHRLTGHRPATGQQDKTTIPPSQMVPPSPPVAWGGFPTTTILHVLHG